MFLCKFNYNLKFIFSVRLFQILFSELIKMNSKDKKKQTYFDKTWLEHEDFQEYVAEVKNEPTKYRCKICHNTNGLWLSNMGICHQSQHHGKNYEINKFRHDGLWNLSLLGIQIILMLILVVCFYQCFWAQISLRSIILVLISCGILSVLGLVHILRTLWWRAEENLLILSLALMNPLTKLHNHLR